MVMVDICFCQVRIDMSEYMDRHAVSRLIGSPPGYVGFEEGGQLTEAVRRRPYAVVLFDEMEKAHPEVFNVLLQLLDDGRLTDSKGNVVNFKNTIIIFTSNIGAQAAAAVLMHKEGSTAEAAAAKVAEAYAKGEDSKEARELTMSALKAQFKPEFLNRIDEFVHFNRLSIDDMVRITGKELVKVNERLAQKNIHLEATDRAKRWLAELGFDPVYGARPLKRELKKEVETVIAKMILEGTCKSGDSLLVDYSPQNVGIAIKVVTPPSAEQQQQTTEVKQDLKSDVKTVV